MDRVMIDNILIIVGKDQISSVYKRMNYADKKKISRKFTISTLQQLNKYKVI